MTKASQFDFEFQAKNSYVVDGFNKEVVGPNFDYFPTEGKQSTGKEIVEWIVNNISEMDELEERMQTRYAKNTLGEILALEMVLYKAIASQFATEGHACLQAMLLGIHLGLSSIIIEGDVRKIIKKCQLDIQDKLEIRAIIRDIQ
ncbi:hypothetical protein Golax_020454 [Gossypium laxum]|uniref:RNase H type-1 domain-containing protein n=1 Tax=Gossypium laxum TaxID=34288 RepID=A0A7J9B1T3_9ROSI|nr:hypothetical protein [Gossypium laxum]